MLPQAVAERATQAWLIAVDGRLQAASRKMRSGQCPSQLIAPCNCFRLGHGAPESPRPSDLQILVLERNVLLGKDHDVIAEKYVSGESILNRLLGSASMAPTRSRADSRVGSKTKTRCGAQGHELPMRRRRRVNLFDVEQPAPQANHVRDLRRT